MALPPRGAGSRGAQGGEEIGGGGGTQTLLGCDMPMVPVTSSSYVCVMFASCRGGGEGLQGCHAAWQRRD